MTLYEFGLLEEAARTYRSIISRKTNRKFSSRDAGICSYKARHNLALVYMDMKRPAEAENQWLAVLAERSQFIPAWRGIVESLLAQNRTADAERWLDELLMANGSKTHAAILALKGEVALARGDLRTAKKQFSEIVNNECCDESLLQAYSRLLVELGETSEAEKILRKLLKLAPSHAANHQNLAKLLCKLGRYEEAISTIQESIRCRPESIAAHQLLADVQLKLTKRAKQADFAEDELNAMAQ
jgi:predicted Zn-dependent protease